MIRMNGSITVWMVWVLVAVLGCTQGVAMPFNHTDEGGPLTLEAAMIKIYDAAADDVNRLAGRAILELAENAENRAAYFREIRAAQLSAQIQSRLDRLGADTSKLLDGPLKNSVNAAIKRGDEELAKIGLPLDASIPGSGASFGLISGEVVEVIAQDTIARASQQIEGSLAESMNGHAENARVLFRSLSTSVLTAGNPQAEAHVNTAIARGLISGNATLADRAIRELFADDSDDVKRVRKLGNKHIEVGKATMTVRQYAMTVTRTRMREATVEARHQRIQSRGVNLVQITGRNSTNFCTAFIGLVCSIGPTPSIDGLEIVPLSSLPGGGPPFHPNCSKGTAPYIHELASSARQADALRASAVYLKRAASGDLLKPVK